MLPESVSFDALWWSLSAGPPLPPASPSRWVGLAAAAAASGVAAGHLLLLLPAPLVLRRSRAGGSSWQQQQRRGSRRCSRSSSYGQFDISGGEAGFYVYCLAAPGSGA
jgi:hypothetical protein